MRNLAHFRTYLRRQGINDIPLAIFRGNRFNILFYDGDGAGIYYLRLHFEEYLKNHPLNRLLQSVLSDLRVAHHIAGCKALGLIDKFVIGPNP